MKYFFMVVFAYVHRDFCFSGIFTTCQSDHQLKSGILKLMANENSLHWFKNSHGKVTLILNFNSVFLV